MDILFRENDFAEGCFVFSCVFVDEGAVFQCVLGCYGGLRFIECLVFCELVIRIYVLCVNDMTYC